MAYRSDEAQPKNGDANPDDPRRDPSPPLVVACGSYARPKLLSNQEKGETGKAQGKVRYRGSGYPGDYPYAEDVIPLLARGKSGYLRG